MNVNNHPENKPDDHSAKDNSGNHSGDNSSDADSKPPILIDDSSNDGKVAPPTNAIRIKGTPCKENLTSSAQDELFLGLAGNDHILADAGNAFLKVGTGDDRIFGDAGSDLLIGSKGRNQLIGGTDQDIFLLQAKQFLNIIRDFENGIDRLGLPKRLTYGNFDISQQVQKTILSINTNVVAILNEINITQI